MVEGNNLKQNLSGKDKMPKLLGIKITIYEISQLIVNRHFKLLVQ